MSNPFFSIIIVSLNAENTIETTVKSVLSQTCDDFEIIIKDGCSSDNTLSKIPNDHRIKVYQESDKSVYDAMNQAIKYANSSYTIFLNCGDIFYDNSVLYKVKEVLVNKSYCCLYGNLYREDGIRIPTPTINDFTLYRICICHQTIFFPTDLHKQKYKYNCKYKIMADYDLEISMYKSGIQFVFMDIIICKYLGGGISESKENSKILERERKEIRKKYFTNKQRAFFGFKYLLTFPHIRNIITSKNIPKSIKFLYRKFANFYYLHSR